MCDIYSQSVIKSPEAWNVLEINSKVTKDTEYCNIWYLFKINNGDTRATHNNCLKSVKKHLTVKLRFLFGFCNFWRSYNCL